MKQYCKAIESKQQGISIDKLLYKIFMCTIVLVGPL